MSSEDVERRLAGLRIPDAGWGLRTRVLARAGEEWILRSRSRRSIRRFLGRWAAAVAAAILLSAGISWREESLTVRCFASRPLGEDPSERALSVVCAEAGLNHGYAARWAAVLRGRRASEGGVARLWREMAIQ